ncbi:MAG TPA: hypothetical protein VK436_13715 [Methanocella sp.]|nr:hypothetical protein [Methanocella sp.]
MTETRGDMRYSGLMTMPGGSYRQVSVEGVITIDGGVDCQEIRTEGVFTSNGDIKAGAGRINGVATIKGSLESGDMNVNGEFRIEGDLSIRDLKDEGRTNIKGSVAAESIEMRGELTVQGDCNAEIFDCNGALRIGGTLNAGDVSVSLYGPSNAKEIDGGKIVVKKEAKSIGILSTLFLPIVYGKARLTVDTIEGDEVALEHTTAKVVRGGTVTIGDGCEIDLVEYRGDFKKTPSAKVLKYVKV